MLPSDQPQYNDPEQVLLYKVVYWLSQISETGLATDNSRVTDDGGTRVTDDGGVRVVDP